MGKQYKGCARVASLMRMVSDLKDADLMTSALQVLNTDALRGACRTRPDIRASQISWTIDDCKHNASKPGLIALLVQSLLACPTGVATRTEQRRQIGSSGGSCRRDRKSPKLDTAAHKAFKTKKPGSLPG